MRLSGAGDEDDAYSIMAADEVTVRSPGPVLGEVLVRGRLLDRRGLRLAGFQQITRVRRESRIIEIEIELDVERQPEADPWQSYYASRLAWAVEAASMYRSVNQASVPTDAVQLESPHFLDVRFEGQRTTLLTGGLPYHRRIGTRKVDTLLVVRGETARRFRLGIGIDMQQPMAAALDFLAPVATLPGCRRPATAAGWLFHLDNRSVTATHWDPLLVEGRVAGFRVRLLETEGRHISLGLRSFRAVQSAEKVGHADRSPTQLVIEGDRLTVALGPYEWAEVIARFA
jgi:alpha-mannosidase